MFRSCHSLPDENVEQLASLRHRVAELEKNLKVLDGAVKLLVLKNGELASKNEELASMNKQLTKRLDGALSQIRGLQARSSTHEVRSRRVHDKLFRY